VPQKGKAATVTRKIPKLQVENLAAQFLEKGQSKNSGETSSLLIFDLPPFILHLGNFLLSSPGLFFISSLSLFIFVLPSNTVFVPRTPKRQVRDPTGVTAGSLRRATYNAPRRRSPHRQSSPLPEPRSPASGSDQHRSNYGQTFLILSSNLSPGTDDLFRYSAQSKSTELMR
jgi:hypothetical protein